MFWYKNVWFYVEAARKICLLILDFHILMIIFGRVMTRHKPSKQTSRQAVNPELVNLLRRTGCNVIEISWVVFM